VPEVASGTKILARQRPALSLAWLLVKLAVYLVLSLASLDVVIVAYQVF